MIGDGLSAYDAVNGHLLWSRKMGFAGNLVVSGKNIYATFDPGPDISTWGFPPSAPSVPGMMSLDAATGSPIWQKMMTTPHAGDLNSDSIQDLLVYKSILSITQSTFVQGSVTYRTTAMDTGGKVLWQINLGGSEVLIP